MLAFPCERALEKHFSHLCRTVRTVRDRNGPPPPLRRILALAKGSRVAPSLLEASPIIRRRNATRRLPCRRCRCRAARLVIALDPRPLRMKVQIKPCRAAPRPSPRCSTALHSTGMTRDSHRLRKEVAVPEKPHVPENTAFHITYRSWKASMQHQPSTYVGLSFRATSLSLQL